MSAFTAFLQEIRKEIKTNPGQGVRRIMESVVEMLKALPSSGTWTPDAEFIKNLRNVLTALDFFIHSENLETEKQKIAILRKKLENLQNEKKSLENEIALIEKSSGTE